jgi:hypothetical protein
MKTFLSALILLLFLTIPGFSQPQMIWTDPVAFTDSVSDNFNVSMPGLFSYGNGFLMAAWEKRIDANTTALFGRDVMSFSTPFPILSQPDVQYRQPCVVNWISGDTLCVVIYETNQNGNWDIYGSKILQNGTVAATFPIRNTSADEINFRYSTGRGMVWEENGAIIISNYQIGNDPSLMTTLTIDAGECHEPVISGGNCAWIKSTGMDSILWYSAFHYDTQSWSAPMQLSDGVNKNLAMGDDYSSLTWQKKEGDFWRLKIGDLYSQTYTSVGDFEGSNNIDPALTSALIVTKQYPGQAAFYSFSSDVTGNFEVYVNQSLFDTTFFNISNHPTLNLHPQFYSSMEYLIGYETIFLFWESLRNHHSQIWMSHMDIPEGIEDHEQGTVPTIQNSPNPFAESTRICYSLVQECHTSLIVYDLFGKQIVVLQNGRSQKGYHTLNWDGKDGNGNPVPPGIYVCSLRANEHTIQRKLTVY